MGEGRHKKPLIYQKIIIKMSKSQQGVSLGTIKNSSMSHDELADKNSLQNELDYSNIATSERAEIESGFVIFKLVNTKKQGRVHIDHINDAVNPKTNKVERLRLLSGINSIWLKDQKEVTEEYAKSNRRSLVFEGKILRIPSWDYTAIEFARTCSHCIDNPKRKSGSKTEFFEWNPSKQAEEALKRQHFKIDAMQKALTCPEDRMKKHALYLNVSFIDEVGMLKTAELIRRDYALKAEENPQKFMDTYDSELVEISYLIKKAVSESKIDTGRERNKAYWATGKFICSIPPSQSTNESLLEFASSKTPEGVEFLEQLKLVN
jgi:hypothetical protein